MATAQNLDSTNKAQTSASTPVSEVVTAVDNSVPEEYDDAKNLEILAFYLRHAVKNKDAVQHDKHVEYFKGSALLQALVEPEGSAQPLKKWPQKLPKIRSETAGIEVATRLLHAEKYFHRSEKVERGKGKPVSLIRSNLNLFEREDKAYYTWLPGFEGSKMWANLGTGLLIAIVLGCTLMPIWPLVFKKAVWWLSVTLLIVIIGFVLIRTAIFTLFWAVGYEFWIMPNIFDESKPSFREMFTPYVQFEPSAAGQMYYRLGLLGCMVGAGFWVMSQPAEFDTFLSSVGLGIDDLYAGNLLSDTAANHKAHLDKVLFRRPSFEELQMDEEDRDKDRDRDGRGGVPTAGGKGRKGPLSGADADAGGEYETVDLDASSGSSSDDRERERADEASMEAMLEELTRLKEEEEQEQEQLGEGEEEEEGEGGADRSEM